MKHLKLFEEAKFEYFENIGSHQLENDVFEDSFKFKENIIPLSTVIIYITITTLITDRVIS